MADIAYAHLLSHVDQKGRERIDALIAGLPDPHPGEATPETAAAAASEGSSALAAMNEMRKAMGQPEVTGLSAGARPRFNTSAAKMPSATDMQQELDLVAQMRAQMGKSTPTRPPSSPGPGPIRI